MGGLRDRLKAAGQTARTRRLSIAAQDRQDGPAIYDGYRDGRHWVKLPNGEIVAASRLDTNGALEVGKPVRFVGGAIDAMPYRNPLVLPPVLPLVPGPELPIIAIAPFDTATSTTVAGGHQNSPITQPILPYSNGQLYVSKTGKPAYHWIAGIDGANFWFIEGALQKYISEVSNAGIKWKGYGFHTSNITPYTPEFTETTTTTTFPIAPSVERKQTIIERIADPDPAPFNTQTIFLGQEWEGVGTISYYEKSTLWQDADLEYDPYPEPIDRCFPVIVPIPPTVNRIKFPIGNHLRSDGKFAVTPAPNGDVPTSDQWRALLRGWFEAEDFYTETYVYSTKARAVIKKFSASGFASVGAGERLEYHLTTPWKWAEETVNEAVITVCPPEVSTPGVGITLTNFFESEYVLASEIYLKANEFTKPLTWNETIAKRWNSGTLVQNDRNVSGELWQTIAVDATATNAILLKVEGEDLANTEDMVKTLYWCPSDDSLVPLDSEIFWDLLIEDLTLGERGVLSLTQTTVPDIYFGADGLLYMAIVRRPEVPENSPASAPAEMLVDIWSLPDGIQTTVTVPVASLQIPEGGEEPVWYSYRPSDAPPTPVSS